MSVSILVVDDEPDVAELFRQRFRRETRQGVYVLHYTASGGEALDRLAAEIEPTLLAVLSDINMPGMDGLALLGEIRQRFPDLPDGMAPRTEAVETGRRPPPQAAQCGLDGREHGATLNQVGTAQFLSLHTRKG